MNSYKLLEFKPFNIYIETLPLKIRLLFKVKKPGIGFLFCWVFGFFLIIILKDFYLLI